MSAKHIRQFLEQLCDTTFQGGRIIMADADTMLLYDVPWWPGTRTDALKQRFPHCDVDVHQAQNSSASGFVVVVSTRHPVGCWRVAITFSITIAAALLVGFSAMSVFLSEHADWADVNMYHHNESCGRNNTQ
jgi:hypothetical protein